MSTIVESNGPKVSASPKPKVRRSRKPKAPEVPTDLVGAKLLVTSMYVTARAEQQRCKGQTGSRMARGELAAMQKVCDAFGIDTSDLVA